MFHNDYVTPGGMKVENPPRPPLVKGGLGKFGSIFLGENHESCLLAWCMPQARTPGMGELIEAGGKENPTSYP
jgi:hypothetical protein